MELNQKRIDRSVILNSWEDLDKKYPAWRTGLTKEEETEFVYNCLDLYEREVFSKDFLNKSGVDLVNIIINHLKF